ncbi:MAG: type II toxin-antitoxin system RelE family toxin [Candidatus Woesearchaeota archaeon]
MYSLEIKPDMDKILTKIKKRNPKELEIIFKKVDQILENPYHFKPLKNEYHGTRRVHVNKSFVLIYEIDDEKQKIILLDYDHHDNIYEK